MRKSIEKMLRPIAVAVALTGAPEGKLSVAEAGFLSIRSVCLDEGATNYPLELEGKMHNIPLSSERGTEEKRATELEGGWVVEYQKDRDGRQRITVKRGVEQFGVRISRDCNVTS